MEIRIFIQDLAERLIKGVFFEISRSDFKKHVLLCNCVLDGHVIGPIDYLQLLVDRERVMVLIRFFLAGFRIDLCALPLASEIFSDVLEKVVPECESSCEDL